MHKLYLLTPITITIFLQLKLLSIPGYEIPFSLLSLVILLSAHLVNGYLQPNFSYLYILLSLMAGSFSIFLCNLVLSTVNVDDYLSTYLLYSLSLLLLLLLLSTRVSLSFHRSFSTGIFASCLILFFLVLIQLLTSLGFINAIDPTPFWGPLTIGSNASNILVARYQDVGLSDVLGRFFARPCAFYYEPSWVALVANSLLSSCLVLRQIDKCDPQFRRYNNISIALCVCSVLLSFSASGILFLPLVFTASFSRFIFRFKFKFVLSWRTILLLPLISIILISLSRRLQEITHVGSSGWFRIVNPIVEMYAQFDYFYFAVPLGNLLYNYPNFYPVLISYTGIFFLILLCILYVRLRIAFCCLDRSRLYLISPLDRAFSIMLTYLAYAAASTGAVLTPEFIALYALLIIAFKTFLAKSPLVSST